jgi:hypothetical protein
MLYKKPYTYFTNHPGGGKDLLMGSLALLSGMVIPLVGQVVWMGYQAEVVEDLERDPDIQAHQNFDLNRFSDYLSRGVWPFLMSLIIGLFIGMMAMIAVVAGFATTYFTQVPWSGLLVMMVLYFPIVFIGTLLTWPLILHVQLSNAFRIGKAMQFTMRFLKILWGQLTITLFVHMVISMVMMFAGMLCCFIGIFPAALIVTMAQEHYMIQLYRLYLAEGGDPIVRHTDEMDDDEE